MNFSGILGGKFYVCLEIAVHFNGLQFRIGYELTLIYIMQQKLSNQIY